MAPFDFNLDLPPATALVKARVDGSTKVLLWRDGTLHDPGWSSLDALVRLTADELEARIGAAADAPLGASASIELEAPAETQEVWAAGVTYGRSRQARVEEAVESSIYDRVYDASRPEIFFKASGWRVVAPHQAIGIRTDSGWDVPEPELALLVNTHGEVIAYAVGNDVSSRSIEADNPLYLPQAKIYDRSCALGPAAVLSRGTSPGEIILQILRNDELIFEGSSHPSAMIRSHAELIAASSDWYSFPQGFWLMTGTGIVPPLEFTLKSGDRVRVLIEGVGALENPVTTVGPAATPAEAAGLGETEGQM